MADTIRRHRGGRYAAGAGGARACGEGLRTDLHGDVRVGKQVEVPGRVVVRAAVGGRQDVEVAVASVDERGTAQLAGFPASGRRQQVVPPRPGSAAGLLESADVLSDPGVR